MLKRFCHRPVHTLLPQEMIRRVEQQQRQEQLADVTAQLMLLSAVRKVGARLPGLAAPAASCLLQTCQPQFP